MKRPWNVLATVAALSACLGLFAYCCPFVLEASDTGWILRAGQAILQTHQLPATDIFSWTYHGRWVLYQWLFELIAGTLFQWGGLWLAGIASYTLLGFVLLYLLPRRWLDLGLPPCLTFLFLLATFTPPWFYIRPQIASYILLYTFLSILEYYRGKPGKGLIWLLPALMILWVNLHSFWFIGLMAVACYAVTADRKERKALWLVFLGCLPAILANPYGLEIINYNISFLSEPDFKNIGELRSPISMHEPLIFLFLSYLCVCWVLLIKFHRAVPKAGLVFAGVASIAALAMSRFCPIAAIATWPYLGLALQQARAEGSSPTASTGWNEARLGHVVLAVLAPIFIWCVRIPNDTIAAETFMNNDLEAIQFLSKHKTADFCLNDPSTGSRLILFGLGPVFIDNRFDMYGKEFCKRWQDAVDLKPGWQLILNSPKSIGRLILPSNYLLTQAIAKDPHWLLVYDDGALTYWLSNSSEHKKRIAEWRLASAELASCPDLTADIRKITVQSRAARSRALGIDCLKEGQPAAAVEHFADYATLVPTSADAHHWLIHTLAETGQTELLKQELKVARPFFWTFAQEEALKPDLNTEKRPAIEQQRIHKWVESSASQLLAKYRKTN